MCRVRSPDFNLGLVLLQFGAEYPCDMQISFDGAEFVHSVRFGRDDTAGFGKHMILVGKIERSLQETSWRGLPASHETTDQTTYTMNGTSHIAATVTLTAEANGHQVTQTTSSTGAGKKTILSVTRDAGGGATRSEVTGLGMARGGRRALRRRGRGRNVQIWTLGKLTGWQESVNFRSLNLQRIVHGSIRGGR